MSANYDLDRRIADSYATETPTRAPDRLLESALAIIDTTPQRRVLVRVPWRFLNMSNSAKLAVAAVAVIAVGAVALAVLRPGTSPGIGGGRSPSPSTLSSPAASASASQSSSAPPALTETFTSVIHGLSISYPAGWNLQPATEPWTAGMVSQMSPFADVIYEKQSDTPFIAVASQPLAGKTGDQWASDYLSLISECGSTESVTVDGAPGTLAPTCGMAMAWIDERGYLIWLYRIDDPDWFQEILATVQLSPRDALDAAPSASPSGS